MTFESKTPVAILGSGNIGTDLMYKVLRSEHLSLVGVAGIDPASEGLERGRALGVETSSDGVQWILDHRDEIYAVFEATSAWVHRQNAPLLAEAGIKAIDLTPARVGPVVVPLVNLEEHFRAPNVNLITCGGQATVPIVHAVTSVTPVAYAEIVSTVASKSAGPGTRQNIDEFTTTTAAALSELGGAGEGKAIMVLNPAEPPILMRNTVMCGIEGDFDEEKVVSSIDDMVSRVAEYVPGYRQKAVAQIERDSIVTPSGGKGSRVTVLLEVEGAGDYLEPYAGNLDIMTASAIKVAESLPTSVTR